MTGPTRPNRASEGSTEEGLDGLLREPESLAWMEEHLNEMRRAVYGQRLLYQSLVFAFVVGLAAHVGGYLLGSASLSEPLGLLSDLLYGLGLALWTGVVVVVFVQIVPEVKRRQMKHALEVYESALRERAGAGGDHGSSDEQESA